MTEQTPTAAVPTAHEDTIQHYEYLQSQQGYGGHPLDMGRAVELFAFIAAQYNGGISIIDCSCGRGFLLSFLMQGGFQVEGTEASDWLIKHALKPRNIPVQKLFYSELHKLPSASWDIVVSNDVLEHLFTEDEVDTALKELSRMARRWLLVSVGIDNAARSLPGRFVLLHHVVRPPDWWVERVSRVAAVRKHYRYHNSYMIFAEITPPESPPSPAPADQ